MTNETPSREPTGTKWITVRLTGILDREQLTVKVDARSDKITRIACYTHKNEALLSLIRRMAEKRGLAAFKIQTGTRSSPEEAHMIDFGIPLVGITKRMAPHRLGGVLFVLNGHPTRFRVTDEGLIEVIAKALKEKTAIAVVQDLKSGLVVSAEQWEEHPPAVSPPLEDVMPAPDNKPSHVKAGEMFNLLAGLSCRMGYLANGAFEHVHSLDCIPWACPEAGCDERASFAALILSEQFSEFEDSLCIVTSTQTAEPGFCCPCAQSNPLEWEYHKAVAVAVSNPDDELVLDPTLFNAPVTKQQWATHFNATIKKTEGYTNPGNPIEQEAAKLEGYKNMLDLTVIDQGKWPPYQTCP